MSESHLCIGSASTRSAGGKRYIEGILPYGSLSQDLGGFVEKIQRGAFRRALAGEENVSLFWAHEPTMVLASLHGKSLRLWDAPDGLHFEARLRDTEAQREIFEIVQRDAPDVSFGFYPVKDRFEGNTRILEDVRLTEITVGLPKGQAAYPAAQAVTALRARQAAELEAVMKEFLPNAEDVRILKARQELELEAAQMGIDLDKVGE